MDDSWIRSRSAIGCRPPPKQRDDILSTVLQSANGRDLTLLDTPYHRHLDGARPRAISTAVRSKWYEVAKRRPTFYPRRSPTTISITINAMIAISNSSARAAWASALSIA